MRFFLLLTIFLLNLFFAKQSIAQSQENVKLDSINFLFITSKNTYFSKEKRINSLKTANTFIQNIRNDSVKNEKLKEGVKLSYKLGAWHVFHSYRNQHLNSVKKNKDIFGLAKTLEYSGFYFQKISIPDSAYYYYYKSCKLYKSINDSIGIGKVLLNIAALQKNIHDYTGSEITSFEALSYFKFSDNDRRVASLYNNLGIVYNQLEDWKNAIRYHQKAFALRQKLSHPIYELHSLNNIGMVYKNKGDYTNAKSYFNKALKKDSLLSKHLKLKAMLKDNHAHARFKEKDTASILSVFLDALALREQINDSSGIVVNHIHLAEYYSDKKDTTVALNYATKAENIAKSIHLYRDYLVALKLRSELVDEKTGKTLLNTYIKVKDSLDKESRKHKKKFERIKFEVDEMENIISSQESENKKSSYVIIGLIVATFTLIFLYALLLRKKRKQKAFLKESITQVHKLKKELFSHKEREKNNRFFLLEKDFDVFISKKYNLNGNDLRVLNSIAEGLSRKEYAEFSKTKENTIKTWRNELFGKLKKATNTVGHYSDHKAVVLYYQELLNFQAKTQKKDNNTEK